MSCASLGGMFVAWENRTEESKSPYESRIAGADVKSVTFSGRSKWNLKGKLTAE